jgi:hypothetical protein
LAADAAHQQPLVFSAYRRFNEEMCRAAVLVAAEGLNPGCEGARIAGFYVVDVKSRDEAIEGSPASRGSSQPPPTAIDALPTSANRVQCSLKDRVPSQRHHHPTPALERYSLHARSPL